jgi:ribosomal protein S27E
MSDLISWLLDYVSNQVDVSTKKMERLGISEDYFVYLGKQSLKTTQETNFAYENLKRIIPDDLLVFNKPEFDAYLQTYTYDDFPFVLRILAKILSDFEERDMLNDVTAQAILQHYEYLKQYFFWKFPDAKQQYESLKARTTSSHLEVTCPECDSTNIVSSSGINWLCKNCGRQFRKNPRRKQH